MIPKSGNRFSDKIMRQEILIGPHECPNFVFFSVIFALFCAPARAQEQSFAAFEAALWPDAQAKGITRATFDLALKGVTPDQRVIAATKRQPEYGKPVGAYVNDLASRGRIANGQRKAKEWAKTFDAVEKKFGVERWVLLALWGVETDYGAEKDHWDVFRSLATLGYVGYRDPYFRNELIVAMRIMQDNHFGRDKMVSSWAGAMGQTQFMPSNVVDYAIDFSGDGKRDLWSNVPDVLASTANYLAKEHWKRGLPWGFEVTVPKGFDYRKSRGSFADWKKLGVRRADGKPFPPSGPGILFFPSGANGPAFFDDGKLSGAQGIQQLRCLCDRGRPSRRPHEWRAADQGGLARRRPSDFARRAHRLAEETRRARL